jgi:hypothetical protein
VRKRYRSWKEFRATSPALHLELAQLATRAMPDLRGIEMRDLPDGAPANTAELGELAGTLHKPGENRVLHTGFGAVSLLAGVAMLIGVLAGLVEGFSGRNHNPEAVVGLLVLLPFVAFLLWLGTWYGFFRKPWHAVTLWVFENGILCQRGARLAAFPWRKVFDFEVAMERGEPIYRITFRDDTEVAIGVADGAAALRLLEFAEIRLTAARLTPTLRRIYANRRANFGELNYTLAGVSSTRFFAPWSEVNRIVTSTQSLFIGRRDHPGLHAIPYRWVSFPLLAIAVAHVMIKEESRLGA